MDKIMGHGGYVCAGVDTFADLVQKFFDVDQSNHMDKVSVANFFDNTVNKYLYSYGSSLSYKTKKMSKNHAQNALKVMKRINSYEFMKTTNLLLDSGGFQVSMGAIETSGMPRFIQEYYQFLKDNKPEYTWAFSLDLPPGPGSEDIFESYRQIEELNRLSYQTAVQLPQDIKDKIIYIHHFRTPSLYKTWTKFLFEEGLGDGYQYYGTGGIVANLASDITIPVIIYTIPLSSVLRYVKSKNMTKFKFHILGGANFADVFYHKLFSHHIKVVHGIDIDITYDSSAIFKGLLIGRYIPVLKQNQELFKMDLKSDALHMQFDGMTRGEKVYQLLNEMARQFNFKELNETNDPIYDMTTSKTGNIADSMFSKSINMYLMMYILYTYRMTEILSEKVVEKIYPLYQSGQGQLFDEACSEFTKKINQGRTSRKQRAKTCSLNKSLKILEDLDEDFNEYLVNKFMLGSDISVMDGSGGVKF